MKKYKAILKKQKKEHQQKMDELNKRMAFETRHLENALQSLNKIEQWYTTPPHDNAIKILIPNAYQDIEDATTLLHESLKQIKKHRIDTITGETK